MAELLLVDYGCLNCGKRFKMGEIMHFSTLGRSHGDKEKGVEDFHFAMSTCEGCAKTLKEEYFPESVWTVHATPAEPTWPKLFGNAMLGGAACCIFRLEDGSHYVFTADHGDHTCAVLLPAQGKNFFEEKFKTDEFRCSPDGTKRWIKSVDRGEPPVECTRCKVDTKLKDLTQVRHYAQAKEFGFSGVRVTKSETEYLQ